MTAPGQGFRNIIASDGTLLIDVENKTINNMVDIASDEELTASGAVTAGTELLTLNHATVIIAATLPAAPVAGQQLTIVNTLASGTTAHTVQAYSNVTFDGTNNTVTLNAPGELLDLIAVSATRYVVKTNIGGVTFSST